MIDLDIEAVPKAELPALLGELARLQGEALARLAESTHGPISTPDRLLTADEAAQIAGTSKRWILSKTRNRRFRHDLSRKPVRFEESGLRPWLASRGGAK
jgi:predicted DNA-binding transcriptional regulator AlpA